MLLACSRSLSLKLLPLRPVKRMPKAPVKQDAATK
jgi:hypothetical protein